MMPLLKQKDNKIQLSLGMFSCVLALVILAHARKAGPNTLDYEAAIRTRAASKSSKRLI